jgi:hypothetical protein
LPRKRKLLLLRWHSFLIWFQNAKIKRVYKKNDRSAIFKSRLFP